MGKTSREQGKSGRQFATLSSNAWLCSRANLMIITRPDICMQPRCMDTIPIDEEEEEIGVIHRRGIGSGLICDHLIVVPQCKYLLWMRYL